MSRGPISERAQLHLRINEALKAHAPGSPEADKALNECPDMECSLCAMLVCKHMDPMHFHHDGCPSCAEALA